MARNPKRTIFTETAYHLREGSYADAKEVLAHEGLKKGVEKFLWVAGSNPIGRAALRAVEGGPVHDPRLHTNVGTLEMAGPVGLAPGWSKDGLATQAWHALGARHMTLGAAPLFSQSGNPMPRLRTMSKKAGNHGVDVSQNWLGFNSRGGIDQLVYNIFTQREKAEIGIPIIVQITLNKEFYQKDLRSALRPILVETVKKALQLIDGVRVVDGLSLGFSSPNTENMRELQGFLSDIIQSVGHTAKGIDPDIMIIYKGDGDGGEERLDGYARMVEVQDKKLIDAFEVVNTTRLDHILAKYNVKHLNGGLAGNDEDYKRIALEAIRHLYERVGGIVDIIGTGGGAHQTFEMIEAGASAVGINTGVRTRGLGVMRKVEKEIIERIERDYPRITSLDQVVGAKTERGPKIHAKETEEQRRERWLRGVHTGNYSADPSRSEW